MKRVEGRSVKEPKLGKKEEIAALESVISMLRRNNGALMIRSEQFAGRIKELEKKVEILQEDNAILRSQIRRLKRD